jgi:hypothetical protein
MVVITETGCIKHVVVQWDRVEEGHSIFKCLVCGLDVSREAEDSQG